MKVVGVGIRHLDSLGSVREIQTVQSSDPVSDVGTAFSRFSAPRGRRVGARFGPTLPAAVSCRPTAESHRRRMSPPL